MSLLTVEELAEELAVSPRTVYNNWRTWDLPAIRVGGGPSGPLRFRSSDVEELTRSWEEH
ncbi:DNA-binding protein [Actinopolyspora erythraea]|uniref:DNA-binding protein n=1 Tax=Actinopolyspora erythraea TaxID=414996 RepID=A0A223RRJ4_9ACTN|nr:DNA-binding protein [Actinopolyspora erythraea]